MKKIFILLLTLVSLNVIVYAGTEVVHNNCAGGATTIQRDSSKPVAVGSQADKIQQKEIQQELKRRREARLKYWNKVQEQRLKEQQEKENNKDNTEDTVENKTNNE